MEHGLSKWDVYSNWVYVNLGIISPFMFASAYKGMGPNFTIFGELYERASKRVLYTKSMELSQVRKKSST